MKTQLYPIILFAITFFVNACAPVYKCGESIPGKKDLTWSKRLTAVVDERDLLCRDLASEKRENELLTGNLNELTNKNLDLTDKFNNLTIRNTDLQEKYSSLINQNLSQSEQYNRALEAKSQELENKELLLSEREKALKEMQLIIARQDSITNRLNDILRNALLGFNSDELSVEILNGKVYVSMSERLLFKSGSSTVESKGVEALKLLADVLGKNPDVDILVEGHTDNVPIGTNLKAKYPTNWELSTARATNIARYLIEKAGIDSNHISVAGYADTKPIDTNETAEGRMKNRRIEIVLMPIDIDRVAISSVPLKTE